MSKANVVSNSNEPTVTKENYKIELIKALNWYNINWDEKDFRKAAEQYCKQSIQVIKNSSFYEIKSIGAIGRLVARQQYIDQDTLDKINMRIKQLNKNHNSQPEVVDKVATPVASIQDRIIESANFHASEVDSAIDQFILNDSSFSMKKYLASNQVSGVVAKKIGELYKPSLKEVEHAMNEKDDQLVEGYGNFTKRKLKQFYEFLQNIIADCNQQVMTAKSLRKPRKRKAKPASVIVKKMTYMREYAPLNLKSISPEEIIKSSELWVYNTVTRKLIVYYADNGTLGVSGMSITNYDVNKSEVKTLRKPEEFFKKLTSTGKRAMANAWKSIKAKVSSPRARINEDMILLSAN